MRVITATGAIGRNSTSYPPLQQIRRTKSALDKARIALSETLAFAAPGVIRIAAAPAAVAIAIGAGFPAWEIAKCDDHDVHWSRLTKHGKYVIGGIASDWLIDRISGFW